MPADRSSHASTRLAHWRLARGVSQARLARAVGLTRTTYWRLEHGRYRNPPLRYLVNCAIALGVELDELIEDEWREWFVFDRRHAAVPPRPEELWQRVASTGTGRPTYR